MKVVIVGGGQMGTYIASLLLKSKCDVVVIENREPVFEKLQKELPHKNIMLGDGTNPNVLEAAGIAKADVVAAVSGADETNLVVSTISKFEFGVPRVISRVNNPKNMWLFTAEMGVDVALNQADLLAHLVVEEMDLKHMYTLLKVSHGNYSIAEVKADKLSPAVGKAVRDLALPANSVLIAITRNDTVVIPRGDTLIESGDAVLLLADSAAKETISTLFHPVV